MTDRSDHLIERAAALLRSGGPAPAEPDRAAPAASPRGPDLPAGPGRAGPGNVGGIGTAAGTGNAAGSARPVPPPPGKPILDPRPRPARGLALGGRVTDLRPHSANPPITLAALEAAGMMVARTGRTRTAEEYRIVMGRVLRALYEDDEGMPLQPAGGAANVVLVTSARPGEGKSFTALNLSGSIAQNAGESVLLIDVDAKRNSLTDHLGLEGRPGFLDLVGNSDVKLEEIIVPTDLPQLSILPLGRREAGRGDELVDLSLEVRRLTPPISRIAERFPRTLIVLDAPPCLSTSDPHTFAPAVGQVVMVVEAERTQRSEIEAAVDLVRVCPNITMLLNKVRTSSGLTFGSYDYFGSYT